MIFGGIVCAAGFIGVTLGSASAQYFRQYDGRADPFVCAIGVFVAVPFTFFGLVCARSYTGLSWIFLFLAVTALSTNWAVVSDMVLSLNLPNKRAFATAMQIMLTHLLGDATSPFITGGIRDLFNNILGDDHRAFLYSLLLTLIPLTLGAGAFLYSAKFYVQDVETCKIQMNADRREEGNGDARVEAANLTDFA